MVKILNNNDYVSPDDDDGTMPENVEYLSKNLVGHKIVSVERVVTEKTNRYSSYTIEDCFFTLDNGDRVQLKNTKDCCAFTQVEDIIIENLDRLDHAITGVVSSNGYETWHIMADLGEIMQLKVGWSSGNPFYYGYGFNIIVTPAN